MSTFIFGMFDSIDIVLWGGERERKKSTSNELSSVFTNNGDLKIDLGEFLSLSHMRSIIYHIIVERVIINWMFNLLDLSERERKKKENIIKKEISTFYVEQELHVGQNNWVQLISEQGEKRKKNLNAGWACVQCQRMIHAWRRHRLCCHCSHSAQIYIWHATLDCVILLIFLTLYLIELIITRFLSSSL